MVPNAAIRVRAVTKFGLIPRFKLCIPAPARKANKIPINDSPAIMPEDKSTPLCKILSGS